MSGCCPQMNYGYHYNGGYWADIASQGGGQGGAGAPAVHHHNDLYYQKSETHTKAEIAALIAGIPGGGGGGTGNVTWDNITSKPTTYPPSAHSHDDRYYTKAQMDAALAGTGGPVPNPPGIPDAPHNNTLYGRRNSAWEAISTSGGGSTGMVSVLDFGAVADGYYDAAIKGYNGTDNRPAFQQALEYCSLHRKTLFVPGGKYRMARNNTRWDNYVNLPTWVDVLGESRESAIFLCDLNVDETYGEHESKGSAVFGNGHFLNQNMARGTFEQVRFREVGFVGLWSHHKTHSPRHLHAFQVFATRYLHIENCSFYDMHGGAIWGTRCERAVIRGNRAARITTDCYRCVGTPFVDVSHNSLRWGDDDAIAIHSVSYNGQNESYRPVRESVIVAHNIITDSKGIAVLGPNRITVTGNVVSRPHGSSISISGRSPYEGAGSMANIVVTGNMVDNAFMRYDNYNNTPWKFDDSHPGFGSITVGEAVNTAFHGDGLIGYLNSATGWVNSPWDGDYGWGSTFARDDMNDGIGGQETSSGTRSVVISGNVSTRTLNAGSPHSVWGFGQYFHWKGWQDPVMTEAAFMPCGIAVAGDVYGANISDNTIEGFRFGSGIMLRADIGSSISDQKMNDILIANNVVRDCRQGVGKININNAQHWTVDVIGNIFNLDPYLRQPGRRGPRNGTWNQYAGDQFFNCIGVHVEGVRGWRVQNNRFLNCYSPLTPLNENTLWADVWAKDNLMDCTPASDYYDANNKGIGYLPLWPGGFTVRGYGSDPYIPGEWNRVFFTPLDCSYARPSTGYYQKGQFVRNIAAASMGTVAGWTKLVSGNDNGAQNWHQQSSV